MRTSPPRLLKRNYRLFVVCTILMGVAGISVSVNSHSADDDSGRKAKPNVAQKASPASIISSVFNFPMPLPSITVTMTDQIVVDNPEAGKAGVGETIRYTVNIANGGPDPATNLILQDTIDNNTTLVPNSLIISPLAANETYQSVGNMTLASSAIAADCATHQLRSVICNDALRGATLTGFGDTQANANSTAPGNTLTIAGKGTVTLNADGTFVFDPAAGFEGDVDFWYTLGNAVGNDNAKVTIQIGGANGIIWFIGPGGGNNTTFGTQANPLSLTGFNSINTGVGKNPADNDAVFLFEGAHTGPVTLRNGQKLLGQDATVSADTLGAPAPKLGNSYPSNTGLSVTITSASSAITLASSNILAGFTIGNATTAITGAAAGTIRVREVTINTNGQALAITSSGNAFSDATFTGFTSVSSSGGTKNISLVGLTGTLNLGGGTLSGASDSAFEVGDAGAGSGGNGSINYSGTITNSGNRAVSIRNKNGGSVSFSGAITSTNNGILLSTNPNTALNFTGGITINVSSGDGFSAAGGGTINITGTNNIDTTTGPALALSGVTVGSSGISFATVDKNANTGSNEGIDIDNLNSTGGGTLMIASSTVAGTAVASALAGIDISGSSAAVIINSATINDTDGPGMALINNTGVISLNGGTIGSTNDPAGNAVDIDQGNANVTIGAALTKTTANRIVEVTGRTGGTITFSGNLNCASGCTGINVKDNTSGSNIINFSGGTKTLNTGAGAAVTLDNNDTATISLSNGGLDIDTTTGIGFNALNGAAGINITTGASPNSINSAGGAALSIVSSNIGSSGLTFERVDVNGGAQGIILTNTGTVSGTNGGLTITGTGTADGSGGTVQNTTTRGANINNVRSIVFKNMNFTNANSSVDGGQNGSCEDLIISGCNAAIYLNNVPGLATLDNLNLTGTMVENGITAISVANFKFDNSLIDSPGDAAFESGIEAQNLSGTATINNTEIRFAETNSLDIINNDVNLNLTVSGSIFRDTQTSGLPSCPTAPCNGQGGIQFRAFSVVDVTAATPVATANVPVTIINILNSQFLRLRTQAIQVFSDSDAIINLDVVGNTIDSGPNADQIGSGMDINGSENSTLNFNILNNPIIRTRQGSPVNITAFNDAHVEGRVNDNGSAANPVLTRGTGASGVPLRFLAQENSNIIAEARRNFVAEDATSTENSLIDGTARFLNARLDLTLDDNTVTNNNGTPLGDINLTSGSSSSSPAESPETNILCANLISNNAAGTGASRALRVRVSDLDASSNPKVFLEGFTTDTATTWINKGNTPANAAEVTVSLSGTATAPSAPPGGSCQTVNVSSDFASLITDGEQNKQEYFAQNNPFHSYNGSLPALLNNRNDFSLVSEFIKTRLTYSDTASGNTETNKKGGGAQISALITNPSSYASASDFLLVRAEFEEGAPISLAHGKGSPASGGYLSRMVSAVVNAVVPTGHAAPGPMPPPEVNENLGTLPANKSITVVFDVTVNGPHPFASYTNNATIKADGIPDTLKQTITPGDRYNTNAVLTGAPASAVTISDNITFEAVVTPTEGSDVTPNGLVQFKDNGNSIGPAVACTDNGGNTCKAQKQTTLTAGAHTITAEYLGGTNHDPDASNSLSYTAVACSNSLVINSTDDADDGECNSSHCSLREAINQICSDGTITFDTTSGTGTFDPASGAKIIQLTSALPDIAQNLTITGPGADMVEVKGKIATLADATGYRVFNIMSGTVNISGLTISGGGSNIVGLALNGGGVNNAGTLTLTEVAVKSNQASLSGGGIYNTNTLNLLRSTVSNNTALENGAGVYNSGTLSVQNSTIAFNTASLLGGGIYNNSVNLAMVESSTIARNAGSTGGGIRSVAGTFNVTNTIVGDNTVTTASPDLAGVFTSTGFNLFEDPTGATYTETTGDQKNVDPNLQTLLSNNGGRTETLALQDGSPAIDNGNTALTVDQRSQPREVNNPNVSNHASGDASDIGAYEALEPPNAPDLDATSDSGGSFTDNITSDSTPTFTISGVQNNEEVYLLRDGSVVASGTATGTSIQLTDDPAGPSVVPDGNYTYTARRAVNGGLSPQSAALTPVTIDTNALAANAPDLQVVSDTGISDSDDLTRAILLAFDVAGTEAGTTVELFRGATLVASLASSPGGTVTLTDSTALANGPYPYTAKVTDTAGNSVTSGELIVTVDKTAPTITIASVGTPDPTHTTPIPVTINFTESVTGFDASDIMLGNSAIAPGSFTGSNADYSFNLVPSGQGAVTVNISAGVAHDAAGNDNAQATQFSRTFDSSAPTVQITAVSPDPRNTSVNSITIVFSEAVTGFDLADLGLKRDTNNVTLGGTATLNTSDNVTFTLDNLSTLTDTGGTYTLTLTAAGAGIKDNAANALTADSSKGWAMDLTAPTVTINKASTQADPATNVTAINFTVVFSEAVTGFAAADVDLSASAAGGPLSALVTEISPNNRTTYNVEIKGMTSSGDVIASVAAGAAKDAAGNDSVISTSTDNTIAYIKNTDSIYEVNSLDNTGDGNCTAVGIGNGCTLREAINAANLDGGTETITFASALTSGGPTTITLSGAPIGLGALPDIIDSVIIEGPINDRLTISGNNSSRIFTIAPNVIVSISNLTMSNGQANIGGAIFNQGNLTITNSTLTNNNAVLPSGTGGAIDSGGGTLVIYNSTISGNTAAGSGGGIYHEGNSTGKLVDVTITNNRADNDDTSPGAGGGIEQVSSNSITLLNTIVAGNYRGTGSTADDLSGGTFIIQNSLIQTPSTATITDNGFNKLNQNPLLGTLASNGGPTQTHLLLPGSPAINAGSNTFADQAGLTTDQRGTGFPRVIGGGADMGAVEVNYTISATAGTPQPAVIGTQFATQMQATVTESGNLQNNVAVTFTAPNNGASGTFQSTGATTATATTNSSGVATASVFTANGIVGGPYNVVASLAGGAASANFALTNQKANQFITFNALGNKTFGDADFTVSATASSGLTVSFSSQTTGVCTVSGNTVTILTAGTCTIRASQAGDSNYNAAPNVEQSFTVAKANQIITFGALSNKTFGDADFNVSATASSGLAVSFAASGQCTVAGNTVHINGAGSCTITASQAGDANYNAATNVQQTFQIAKAASTTAVTSSLNPSEAGQSVTFTATVTSTAGTPTGTVQFKDGGTNLGSAVALNGSGVATLSTSALAAGTHTITAEYSGDANFNISTGTLTGGQVVNVAAGISIDDISLTEGNSGTKSFDFTVTLSQASNLTVTVDFSTASGTATAATDYQSASGTLTFAPNETQKTVTVLVNGDTENESNETFFLNLTNAQNSTILDNQGLSTILNDDSQVVQFSTASYSFGEAAGHGNIIVNRTGDLSKAMTVDYQTSDLSGNTTCQTLNTGIASDRCDYGTAVGMLQFAAGEQSKTIPLVLINDAYVEGNEQLSIKLNNPQGASLGSVDTGSIIITDDDTQSATQNPIEDLDFFIRQLYIDFLGREPEPAGFQFWKQRMTGNCPAGQVCDRMDAAIRFFKSDEFEERGYFVYLFYHASLGRRPTYSEWMQDVAKLNGPKTVPEQQAAGAAFIQEFMDRQEFMNLYNSAQTGETFVDALIQRSGLSPASRQTLMDNYNSSGRAGTLRAFIETPEVREAFLDRAFVTMLYFGFLRRDAEPGGFQFWMQKLTETNRDYRFMLGGFLRSDEYHFRFALIPQVP